jgi:superfamily II DNA/RNA helicase
MLFVGSLLLVSWQPSPALSPSRPPSLAAHLRHDSAPAYLLAKSEAAPSSPPAQSFAELGCSQTLIRAVGDCYGHTTPMEIQDRAWRTLRSGQVRALPVSSREERHRSVSISSTCCTCIHTAACTLPTLQLPAHQ